MALDHYVTLGRSGLRVSPLCLGAMTFGEDFGWGSSVEESQQILDRFIAALRTRDFPLRVSEVRLSSDPLNSTARGALMAGLANGRAYSEAASA